MLFNCHNHREKSIQSGPGLLTANAPGSKVLQPQGKALSSWKMELALIKRNTRLSKGSKWSPASDAKSCGDRERSGKHAGMVGSLGWTSQGCFSFAPRVQVSLGELVSLGPCICPSVWLTWLQMCSYFLLAFVTCY